MRFFPSLNLIGYWGCFFDLFYLSQYLLGGFSVAPFLDMGRHRGSQVSDQGYTGGVLDSFSFLLLFLRTWSSTVRFPSSQGYKLWWSIIDLSMLINFVETRFSLFTPQSVLSSVRQDNWMIFLDWRDTFLWVLCFCFPRLLRGKQSSSLHRD